MWGGEPGWHGDDVAAQGRSAGDSVNGAGQGAGGAEQVVGERGADRPGTVRWESAGWHVCEGSVDQVGEHGFDDGVSAVGDVGGSGRLNTVGEEQGGGTRTGKRLIKPGPVQDWRTMSQCSNRMAGER